MKLRNLFMAVVAGAAMLVGCDKEVDLGPAKVSLDQTSLAFEAAGGSQEVSLTATRDWAVSGVPEWVAVSPTSGMAAVEAQPIKITVMENADYDHSATIVFTIGFARTSLTVKQAGPKGVIDNGDGSLDNPYNVAGVIAYVNDLGADVTSPKKVFVKGKVSAVDEEFTTNFGNGSFKISDDGTTASAQFTAYRVLYLGNKKFTADDTQVQVGDEVIIYGNVVNYKGNTPETQQNQAFLYSLNGVDKGGAEGGSGETGEPEGTGTVDDPFNVAAAINAVKDLTWTSTTEYDKVGPYYVKGIVKSIGEAYGTQFGNGTFYIKDADTDNEFYVYRALYLNNKKFAAGDTALAEGDEVIIYGELMNYRGNTPETVMNSCYLYSLNGNTGSGSGSGETGEAKGSGTLEDPFNPAGIAAVAEKLADNAVSEQSYYMKGKISKIAVSKGVDQTFANSGSYGNASFYIADAEDGTGEFYIYQTYYLGNRKWVTGDTDIKVGDEVIVYGPVTKYVSSYGTTLETSGKGASYIYSLNGVTEGGDTPGGGDEPGDIITATIAEFNAAAESSTQKYKLTGTIGGSINTTYGNFDLTDETGTVYVYGLTATDLGYGAKNDKSYASLNLAEGDKITIIGYRGSYGDKIEVLNAYFVEKVSGGDQPGGETGGGETGGNEPEGGIYASSVTWTLGNKAYSEKAIVNDVENVPVLKLGNSSTIGTATLTIPSGATKITFYAVSWSGKPSKLVFKNGDTELGSVSPAANTGLANTSPYTLTVTDADKYEIAVSGATSITVQTDGSNKRAALFAIVSE